MPDGSPQVTPVWVDYDGQYIWSTAQKGAKKIVICMPKKRSAKNADLFQIYRFMDKKP
jgi:hypothetical protein